MPASAISAKDKGILRELVKRQLEHAKSEENQKIVRDWFSHNALKGKRPMIHLELWTFQEEVILPLLKCDDENARIIETSLYTQFLNRELFDDDKPVPDFYPINRAAHMVPFGLEVERNHSINVQGKSLGHRFTYHITDLENDFDKLQPSTIVFDRADANRRMEQAGELFGDILPPKLINNCLYTVITQDIIHIMGMETMYISMYECPELFHKMMRQYTDDALRLFRFMENERLLLPTVGFEELGQGSWCFTDELPGGPEDGSLRTKDLWGFMDSQESVGISADMFGEFIFPYYKEISEQFGLLSYGCCEPVHPFWDKYLSTLDNLRKISISPWCDEALMAEKLKGRNVIYHRKPSPNYLGVGATLNEPAFREHIRATIIAARGLPLEITQRDVYTINSDIPKAKRYVDIIKEEIDGHWQA